MQERIRAFIQQHALLDQARPVLVGVSGGLDSMSVLLILHRLGYQIICAHFDHGLRSESPEEFRLVRQAAQTLGVPFVFGSADVQAYQEANGLSLEEAARHLRYRFLFDQAHLIGAQAVVTGHTADDQVETVLMHFLRGAGLSGLKGMRPETIIPTFDPRLPITRPLLGTWRSELVEFQGSEGFAYLTDPTNTDPRFFRNRLRHELLPILERYNPEIRDALLRSSAVLDADDQVLREITEQAWQAAAQAGRSYVRFDLWEMGKLPAGLQARLLRRGVGELLPDLRDLDYAATIRGLALLGSGGTVGACDLVGGLRLMLEYGVGWIASGSDDLPLEAWPQLESAAPVGIEIPGRCGLSDGWTLSVALFDQLPGGWDEERDTLQAFVDADQVLEPLIVRSREPGDRFVPVGMNGHSMRLSDYMINEKLPKRTRARWPLVVSGDRIVWVAGRRAAEDFRLRPASNRFLHLRLLRG